MEAEQTQNQKTLAEQKKFITQLTRENNIAQAKIKQLMSNTCTSFGSQLVDEAENEYEVQAILRHMGKGDNRRFRIRWKNYPPRFCVNVLTKVCIL